MPRREALSHGDGDHTCGVLDVMDCMRQALVVVDSGGSIIHMNRAAVRLLTGDTGLRCRVGRMEALRPATNSELQLNIGRAVRDAPRGGREASTMTCARGSGKLPLVINTLPLGEQPTAGRALVVVVDPDDRPGPGAALIRRVFGMTKAEADIAIRILQGDGLKSVSEELNLSLATVKTHLQHVFDKTGTHRQAELVRLLLGIVA